LLATALNELDAFPRCSGGRPSRFANAYMKKCRQSEKSARAGRSRSRASTTTIAMWPCSAAHDLPAADYFQDNFSTGFAYDGGSPAVGEHAPHFAKSFTMKWS